MNDSELETQLQPELDEALLALDELTLESPEEALSMFETLPEPVQALPAFQLALARTHQAMGELEAARDLAAGIQGPQELEADVHHFLGDVLEDLGENEQAARHFQETLTLDQKAHQDLPQATLAHLTEQLRAVLSETLSRLPAEISPRVAALEKVIALLPTPEEVRDGLDPRALVTYRAPVEDTPGALVLYAMNLYAEYGDLEEFGEFLPHVQECIHREVIEILGLTVPESQRLGLVSED